jgi:peptidoglycan/xylan/chitin deacetylase (PgdA/CDA1 family)
MIIPRFLHQLKAVCSARTPRAMCLMFHRVTDDPSDIEFLNQRMIISSKAFEKTISQVARNFKPLPMDEFVSKMKKGRLPLNAVSVTFDDGFKDNLYTVLPILERYDIPATVYVTTGFVDGSVRAFEYDLSDIVATESHLEFSRKNKKHSWKLQSDDDRRACYEYIRGILKFQTFKQRQEAMSQLATNHKNFQELTKFHLNWEELKKLASSPLITIGGHTHHHLVLTNLNLSDAYAEIVKCKDLLTEHLNYTIRHFAYPYGDYNLKIIKLVRDAGFESAVTTSRSEIKNRDVNAFAIPRIEIID